MAELHPFVLHFAIALLLAAPPFDVFGLILRREALLQAGRWTTLVGAFATAVTVLSGLGAEAVLGPNKGPGEWLLNLHHALGLFLLILVVPVAVWRLLARHAFPAKLRTLYLAGSFVIGTVVTVQTVLGSAMVYRHGVGLSASARTPPAERRSPPTGVAH